MAAQAPPTTGTAPPTQAPAGAPAGRPATAPPGATGAQPGPAVGGQAGTCNKTTKLHWRHSQSLCDARDIVHGH